MQEWLVWVSSGVGAGIVFSYLAEYWKWYQEQLADKKKLIAWLVTSILAVGAYVIYTYVPVEFWTVVSPYWQILVGVFVANGGVQLFHRADKTLL